MTSLPAILSTLDQEITELSTKLEPSRPDFIAECLHKLKAGGMLVPKSIAAADFMNEYTIALGGVPQHGLMVVVAKLKRGEYPAISAEFMPLPAQLAAMARAECKLVRDDITRLRERKITLEESTKQPDTSPEERDRQIARIRDMHAQFKANNQAAREASSGVQHEPMDPGKAEYWSKIQALPDKKELDAHQVAFRRRIAADVDGAPKREPDHPAEPAAEPEFQDVEF
jgi:hypothetical protein